MGLGELNFGKGSIFDAFFFRVLLEDLEENVLNNRKKNVLVNLFFFFQFLESSENSQKSWTHVFSDLH